MPHPQQLKKKRKKGNTKVERRSRELHPDFFFFALTFLASSPSSFQMLLTFQFSFVPFLMQTWTSEPKIQPPRPFEAEGKNLDFFLTK